MTLIADKYLALKTKVNDRFDRLKANEEELNRIFAKIYNMEGEVPIEVEDKYVSVARIFDTEDEIPESFKVKDKGTRKRNKYVRTKRDEIVSLISYAVGCMFGRWSLDKDGLILADAGSTVEDYLAKLAEDGVTEPTWMPDATNVLPITDDVYFEDDLASQLFRWVETVYGKESLEENLAFIANALKPDARATPRDVIREYLIKEFYKKGHLPTYKNLPIYWQLDSGKKNGFKALFYLHRYRPDLLARVRTEYVHPQQQRFRARLDALDSELSSATPKEKARINKERKKVEAQAAELAVWEEALHHAADQMVELDLDDGVKVNYAKLQEAARGEGLPKKVTLLTPIK